jgi:hypothetical protein
VALLLHAISLHPNLPLFAPDAKAFVAAQRPTTVAAAATSQQQSGRIGGATSAGDARTAELTTRTVPEDHHAMPDAPVPIPRQHQEQQQQAKPPSSNADVNVNGIVNQQQPAAKSFFPYQYYPRPGNGLRLPSLTSDDMALLLGSGNGHSYGGNDDDDDEEEEEKDDYYDDAGFSHIYRGRRLDIGVQSAAH